MEKTIYKYPLEIINFQTVLLPVGAQILTIQAQADFPCMWALVDPNESKKENRNIEIYGTGHPIGYDMGISRNYISTFQISGGLLVYHAFEYTGV